MANKTVILKIKRQTTPDVQVHWEEFEIALPARHECDLLR